MYVSSFHSVSPCFVTSFEQVFWSVSSCFRDFPVYLIRFICYETEMGLLKKKDVCLIVSFRFTLFHNEHISNFLVCFILFQSFSYISYSFHLLLKRNGFIKKKKKKMYVSSFHSVSPCFVTSFEQFFWSVSSCFRVFPLYLIRFICYETEMVYKKKSCMFHHFISFHSVS